MRKLYALVAGLCFILTTIPTHARHFSDDIANFSFSLTAPGNTVIFTNSSIIGSEPGIRKAFWSFGDGTGAWTLPLAGTQHTYQAAGTYTVCLKIYRYRTNTGDSILSAQVCKTIIIEAICRADFERLPHTTTNNLLLTSFKALPSHQQDKKPVKICWSFGDGTDTCINYSNNHTGPYVVNHAYTSGGVYEVCVKILYEGGCEARKCKVVEITRPDSCRADFEKLAVSATNNPLTVIYKALPWHANGKKPMKVCWSFGDGRDTCINYLNIHNGAYTVAHTYLQPGQYEVCVKIIYYEGCEARKCKLVQLERTDSCRAEFERVPSIFGNNLNWTSFKALPWHSGNKKPARICWSFGDGRDTCINYGPDYNGSYLVHHLYREAGNYEVCVKIIYYGGCEARKCKIVHIERPETCKADFEKLPLTTANDLLTTVFRALPWHNTNKKPAKICWTFGDGRDTCITYGPDYNGPYIAGHRYQHPGQYEVCVKITYQGGCEARLCKVVVIPHRSCDVNVHEIIPSISSLVRGFYAALSSVPESRPVRICWNFGDGNDTCIVATSSNPPDLLIRHTYPGPGAYRACVRVVFANGCVAEDCDEVLIRAHGNVCGGFMEEVMIAPRTYRFKGFAIHGPNDQVLGYRWTFGDGSSATGREVTHTYNQGGDFEVCLYIKTVLGCETRICKTVRVPGHNQPNLVLSPNPVTTVLHASFFSTHTETVTIKLVNSNGTVIRSITRNAVAGINNWDFDVSNLLPGIYTLLVQSPNQQSSALFIKQ